MDFSTKCSNIFYLKKVPGGNKQLAPAGKLPGLEAEVRAHKAPPARRDRWGEAPGHQPALALLSLPLREFAAGTREDGEREGLESGKRAPFWGR